MQTRQELVLEFMKAMLANGETARVATEEMSTTQDRYVRDVFLLAAKFADKYLETV